MRLLLLTAMAAALVGIAGAHAQTQSPQQRPSKSGASDISKLSRPPHPSCRAWNDGCVSCRSDDGKLGHCTEIVVPGTCIPHEIVCTLREGERRE